MDFPDFPFDSWMEASRREVKKRMDRQRLFENIKYYALRAVLTALIISPIVGGYYGYKMAEGVTYESCVAIMNACEGGILEARLEQDAGSGEGAINCYCVSN